MSNCYKEGICDTCMKTKRLWFEDTTCSSCKEDIKIAKLSEYVTKEGESSNENYIICPYCGNHYSEDDEHESQDVECEECDEKFRLEVEYSVSYSTSKIEDDSDE